MVSRGGCNGVVVKNNYNSGHFVFACSGIEIEINNNNNMVSRDPRPD